MIRFDNVTFTYENAETPACDHLSLCVAAGECVLVTGPSGCGKTTLLHLINGLVPHYFAGDLTGTVEVTGISPAAEPLYAQAGKTSLVSQNPRTQFYTTDSTAEVAFALENQGVPADRIIELIEHSVDNLGVAALMDRSLFALSGGEKQQIACTCADAAGANIVLLDEPTANLDFAATQNLARIVADWKQAGKTIVIVDHRIAWALGFATRVVLMRAGRIEQVIENEEFRQLTEAFCEAHGLRSPLFASAQDANVARFNPQESHAPAYVLNNVHFAYRKDTPVLDFDHISFAQGKITAVVGENGRGKSTFLRCLAGMERRDHSTLTSPDGTQLDRKQRLRQVFLIWQDVNCQLFTQSVREEVGLSLCDGGQASEDVDRGIDEILAALDLLDVADRDPFTLSGGQKQRVAVACAVASKRPILLFDEPTSGLDLAHMQQMASLIKALAEQGKTIVVVTHDREFVQSCADYLLPL